jgi:hypothetical protein
MMASSFRAPTREDYLAYDGAHCKALWASVTESWRCPGCHRSKFEILRWTRRTPHSLAADRTPYWDWLGVLHRHHDHGAEPYVLGVGSVPVTPRFPETIMCDECNGADGRAKRQLGLPADWSFSPGEIERFVTATPHRTHVIDLSVAEATYRDAQAVLPFPARPSG